MHRAKVLVVDDSPEMVTTIARYLADHRFQVEVATSGAEALKRFAALPCDVVLTDLRMKGTDGIDVLEGIHKLDAATPVVLMTAFGNIESAVEAIQRGAYHYVTKPFKMATLRVLLERAARERAAREQNQHLRAAFNDRFDAQGLVGESASMRELKTLIGRVANASSPVLIVGETGTGKELVARAIHLEGERRDAPFVAVSCAAIAETLLENELFGQSSPVTGATPVRRGLFLEADGGTLFLDEVGDLPLPVQSKLLRVLELGEIRPVGGEASRRVDVRCIASTHADLRALVQARAFREDLFFRLDVLTLGVPPLRARREDIALLCDHFLERARERTKTTTKRVLTGAALRALESHGWPGNVRELENLIERLVVTSNLREIDEEAVRMALSAPTPANPIETLAQNGLTMDELEERYMAAVLRSTHGNKPKAAAILGIDLSTLYRRTKQH